MADAEPDADMRANADESREQIVGLHRQAWKHSDTTIEELTLDAIGHVAWWPEERREVTPHHVLVRVIADTHRHEDHTDIVREFIDGAGGVWEGDDSMAPGGQSWWETYRSRLDRVARKARRG